MLRIHWDTLEALPYLVQMFYNISIWDKMVEHFKFDPQNVNDSHPPYTLFFKLTKYDRFRY